MKRDNNRFLTPEEINLGLGLIELILKNENIKNIYQLYDKSLECNWSKLSKMVLSKCWFEIDIKGNIKEFHKISIDDVLIRNIEDCEYARGKCGNVFIIVHL